MRIGTRTLKLKSFKPEELNIDYESGIKCEIHQEVFHISGIPIFPIKKVYLIKKDNDHYDAPYIIDKKLREIQGIKTPWYSFLIPIITLTIIILSFIPKFIASNIDGLNIDLLHTKSYQKNKEKYSEKIKLLDKKIKHLNKNDFIKIKDFKKPLGKKKFLKVIDTSKDSIKFSIIIYNKDGSGFNLFNLKKYYKKN